MLQEAFERLTKRLLRENGFVQVEVTGKSGDGGIDGKGIVKIQNILSYHVVFQCKRYRESVSSSHIRDFRGAMIGRADKGLFITTGTFTQDAIKEARRLRMNFSMRLLALGRRLMTCLFYNSDIAGVLRQVVDEILRSFQLIGKFA